MFYYVVFNRIRGLVKAKALHEQVGSMENVAGKMKVNKEQVYQQIQQLRQRVDQLINDITVSFSQERLRAVSLMWTMPFATYVLFTKISR